MAKLEDLTRGAAVKGILPDQLVTVVDVKWIGNVAVDLTYKDAAGRPANELLYRDRESSIEIVAEGSPWSFDGDGALFRLVSEAQRIRLAYLFDPLLAVHTSMVDPLPHQITAVYGEMLPRQPLRYLLADDPGVRQDHHDGAAHQGRDRSRRLATLHDCLPRQSGRAMAGRTGPPLPLAVRDHDERQAGIGPHGQLVPRELPGDLPPRQAQPRRDAPCQAGAVRLGSDGLR